MKKTRKILAVVLALVTLMSVMSIQSFAYFDWFGGEEDLPTVESVKFADDYAVSLKDAKAYFDDIEEWYGEYDDYDYSIEDEEYDLSYSGVDYKVEVTLSNGKKFEMLLSDWYYDIDDYTVYVEAYVPYNEYIKAKNNNEKTVDVNIYTEVVANNDDSFWFGDLEVDFVLEKNVVDCYVLSITAVSGVPSQVYEYADYYDLNGAKFSVTFADNKTQTLTVTSKVNEYGYVENYIGNNRVFTYEYDGELDITYLDATYTKEVSYKTAPFKSIKITECDFNTNTQTLSSIKGTVTFEDGTVKTFDRTFDEPLPVDNDVYYWGEVVCPIDGFYVWVSVRDYEETDWGTYDTDNFCISASIGDIDNLVTDTYKVENPMGLFLGIKMWITSIIEKIESLLDYIFYLMY